MTESSLPRWDLTNVFPFPASEQYQAALSKLRAGINRIGEMFDEFGVGLDGGAHPNTDPDEILSAWNETTDLSRVMDNYLYCWTSTDSKDDQASSAYGEFEMITSRLRALYPRLVSWLGTLKVEPGSKNGILADHAYQVKRAAIGAQHVMSPELEALAADLQSTGGNAWARARDENDASLTGTITIDGEEKVMTLTELDSLLTHQDRVKRKAAAEAIDASRQAAAQTFGQSLNAIKGEALTLSRRRKWESPLEWSLFESAIDRDILDAMFAAAESVHSDLHQYLTAKARLLGIDDFAYYDLDAPVTESEKELTWADCVEITRKVLCSFSERLERVVEGALDGLWIDAEPREGKVGGGYCANLNPHGSRVMMNFVPAFSAVQTLAHELGHAHHNDCLMGRTALQEDTPMTLAETASMFCQRLVEDAVLAEADSETRLSALDKILNEEVAIILDLHARFHFERDVFERREYRTLSVDEFTQLMERAQHVAYGPGLAADKVQKLQWVTKPHYYDTGFHYYNYPYQFGLLFALGLLRIYREEPGGFVERYETLLSRTGMATAHELAQEFGIDIRDREFWDRSVAVIRDDVKQFQELAAAQKRA